MAAGILMVIFGVVFAYVALGTYGQALAEIGPHRWTLIVSGVIGLIFGSMEVVVNGWIFGIGLGFVTFSFPLLFFERRKLFRSRARADLKRMSEERPDIAEKFGQNRLTRRAMKKLRERDTDEDTSG